MLRQAGISSEDLSSDSEFLATLAVVIPRASEEEFLATYEMLDAESVPYGDESNRHAKRGSPVVPRSARRVLVEGDYVLYFVTILRKFMDSFQTAARAKRFAVREFKYDPDLAMENASTTAALQRDAASALVSFVGIPILCLSVV